MVINMRKLKENTNASVVPIILFILTILIAGSMYTWFFLEIGFPTFTGYIPSSDAKTLLMTLLYGIPVVILVVGVIALVKAGLKQGGY